MGGDARGILGYAYAPNASEPAKLKVHFDQPSRRQLLGCQARSSDNHEPSHLQRAMTMPLSAIPPRSRCSSWRVTMTNSTASTMPPSLTTSTRKVSTPGSTHPCPLTRARTVSTLKRSFGFNLNPMLCYRVNSSARATPRDLEPESLHSN